MTNSRPIPVASNTPMNNPAPFIEYGRAVMLTAARHKYKPLDWAEIAFDWGRGDLAGHTLRDWQADVLWTIQSHLADPETRHKPCRIAVASGHGVGKSALLGMVSNWAQSCWVDARVTITANTQDQLRTKTSPEIGKWFRRSITSEWFDVQSNAIKSKDKKHAETWRTDFVTWSEHNTTAFAGLHNEGKIIVLIMDEASEIPDAVHEVALGAMTDANTVIIWLMFANPTINSGFFREAFRKNAHRWYHMNIDARDVPGTNTAYLNEIVEDFGEDSDTAKRRVRGMFPSHSARQFISTADVDAARRRHLTKGQYAFAPVILGVDPAWTGKDLFVVYKRQGLYTERLMVVERNDDDILMAQKIAILETEHAADAVFVDAGFGTGIVSAGNNMGRAWRLVWFTGASPDPGCLNLRAYIWDQMRAALKNGLVLDPKDDKLYFDLIEPELLPRLDGKKQLESKEDMERRLGRSPDYGDALALTFTEPVTSKRIDDVVADTDGRTRGKPDVFDPFAVLNRG